MKQVKFGEFPVLVGRTSRCRQAAVRHWRQMPATLGCRWLAAKLLDSGCAAPSTEPALNLVSVRASTRWCWWRALRQRTASSWCSARWPATSRSSHPSTSSSLAAGGRCSRRRQPAAGGYRGKLTVLSADSVPPFDRTKLSKSMASEPVLLRTAEHYAQHDIELMLESRVRTVEFHSKNGRVVLPYTKLLVCSGSSARQLAVETPLRGVFYLRSPEDSKQIHAAGQGADAVLIGSSFIALESAAYLVANGAKSVTDPVPFKALFGEEAGKAARRLHESKGVKFVIGELQSFASDAQGGLSGLKLKSGDTLPAQLCVVGIGSTPNTAFLPPSSSPPGSPLVVGPDLRSPSDSNVFGAGDVLGYGHWQTAQTQGRLAARSMLGKPVRQAARHLLLDADVRHRLPLHRPGRRGDGRPSSPWKRAVVAEPKEEFKFMTYLVGGGRPVVAGVAVGAGPAPVVLANLLEEKGQPVDLKSLVHRSNSGPAAGTLPVMQQQQQQPPRSSEGRQSRIPPTPAGRPLLLALLHLLGVLIMSFLQAGLKARSHLAGAAARSEMRHTVLTDVSAAVHDAAKSRGVAGLSDCQLPDATSPGPDRRVDCCWPTLSGSSAFRQAETILRLSNAGVFQGRPLTGPDGAGAEIRATVDVNLIVGTS
uniref:Pyr_redox_2 domain-containing protein n=1 Tax=Macrostomum lignano TaxID=282301 RepID=A0A1I8JPW4_9PLAT